MKPIRTFFSNDHGFSLLLVLLTITIFMLFGFTFMAHALNTTKQSTIIEDRIQATDLAEMGTEYYSYVIEEKIKKIEDDLGYWLINERIPLVSSEQWENIDSLENLLTAEAINKADEMIEHGISPLINNKKTIDHEDSLLFILSDIKYDHNEDKIEYNVIGETEESNTSITSFVHLDLNKIKVNLGKKVSWIDSIAPDSNFINDCDISNTTFVNETCKFSERTFLNNEKPNFTNSKIKVSGNFTLPNINNYNLGYTHFYVKGDFNNTNNLNGVANLKLYVEGDVKIGQMNNAINVLVCAKNISQYGISNNQDNVKVYSLKNTSGNSSVIVNPQEFEENCNWKPGMENGNSSLIWSDPVIKKEFNYQ